MFWTSLSLGECEGKVLSKYSRIFMATLTGWNNVSLLPDGQDHVLPQYPHPRVDHGIGGWRNEQDWY